MISGITPHINTTSELQQQMGKPREEEGCLLLQRQGQEPLEDSTHSPPAALTRSPAWGVMPHQKLEYRERDSSIGATSVLFSAISKFRI